MIQGQTSRLPRALACYSTSRVYIPGVAFRESTRKSERTDVTGQKNVINLIDEVDVKKQHWARLIRSPISAQINREIDEMEKLRRYSNRRDWKDIGKKLWFGSKLEKWTKERN